MGEEGRSRSRSVCGGELAGPLWLGGWLFTIGFLKLATGKAFFALVLWPYYLGVAFHVTK
jgi:hypothetical protein